MSVSGQLDRTIEAGKTDTVEIVLSAGRRNKLQKKVRLQSNDAGRPEMFLECEATVARALTCTPANFNFGSIKRDAASESKTLVIERGEAGPIAPKLRPVANDNISAELREIEPGEKYELEVTIRPPWPNNTLRGTITLDTGVERAAVETIPVYAQIPARLTCVPSRFNVSRAPQMEQNLRAKLVWSDKKPAQILAASVNDDALSVTIEEEGDGQWIVLHVPSDYDASPGARAIVKLTTDDPEVPTMTIPVYANRATTAPRTRTIRAPQGQAGAVTPGSLKAAGPRSQDAAPPSKPAGQPKGNG